MTTPRHGWKPTDPIWPAAEGEFHLCTQCGIVRHTYMRLTSYHRAETAEERERAREAATESYGYVEIGDRNRFTGSSRAPSCTRELVEPLVECAHEAIKLMKEGQRR